MATGYPLARVVNVAKPLRLRLAMSSLARSALNAHADFAHEVLEHDVAELLVHRAAKQ